MTMGAFQRNHLLSHTIDVWKDTVFFNDRPYPAGSFAAAILNVDDCELVSLANYTLLFGQLLQEWDESGGADTDRLRQEIHERALVLLDKLWTYLPFSLLDKSVEVETIETLLSDDLALHAAKHGTKEHDFFARYMAALGAAPWGILHFTWAAWYFENQYLRRLKKRNENYFAVAAHDCFNSEAFREHMTIPNDQPIQAFRLAPVANATYVFARDPGDRESLLFVRRLIFDKVVDFYTYDLFNGMSCGHAPSRCMGCGRYFLTTTGHTPKYCDGRAPQNPKYTCREYGASLRQKEQNAQHPVYRIFKTRTNTIRKHHERGKISDALRVAALEAAEKHRDEALLDSDYAAGGYTRDMAQDAIYEEARRKLGE